jgi:hypothetical protein
VAHVWAAHDGGRVDFFRSPLIGAELPVPEPVPLYRDQTIGITKKKYTHDTAAGYNHGPWYCTYYERNWTVEIPSYV